MGKSVLVTGGAGFIGSHTLVEMLDEGYEAVVVDNLVNACMESLKRVQEIAGRKVTFYQVDLLDKEALKKIFEKHSFDHVVHFAGLKAVGESCQIPLRYYQNNLEGTMTLLELMKEYDVRNMVFSSSATVYGNPQYLPLDEKHPTGGCTNPYGKTKYFIEQILSDIAASDKSWNIVLLRYFNPIGAHKCGRIGEDPQGIPNNLMPFIAQVGVGRLPKLTVFGNQYNTPDGTGVRDYIHVVDLAKGHVAALKKLEEKCGCRVYNLGTGKGYSVFDAIKAFEKASGKTIPYVIAAPRAGDVESCYADPKLAEEELGWKATRTIDEMCEDAWRWQSNNPYGFKSVDQNGSSDQ